MKKYSILNMASIALFGIAMLAVLMIFSEDNRQIGAWIAIRVLLVIIAAACLCGHRVIEAIKSSKQ